MTCDPVARIAAAQSTLIASLPVPYGRFDGYYMSGPFQKGTKQQGPQSPVTPAQHYRKALAAFDKACGAKFGGKVFTALSDAQKDEAAENGLTKLDEQKLFG